MKPAWSPSSACCLLLGTLGLLPTVVRADVGCGVSGLFAIDNDCCTESDVFTIDNGACTDSDVFGIDNCCVAADFDHDGDVDQDDLAIFKACVSGPAIAYVDGCAAADFDRDRDVDQADYGVFLRCLNRAGKPGG